MRNDDDDGDGEGHDSENDDDGNHDRGKNDDCACGDLLSKAEFSLYGFCTGCPTQPRLPLVVLRAPPPIVAANDVELVSALLLGLRLRRLRPPRPVIWMPRRRASRKRRRRRRARRLARRSSALLLGLRLRRLRPLPVISMPRRRASRKRRLLRASRTRRRALL